MDNELENQDSLKPEEEVNDSENVEEIQEGDTDEEKFAKLEEANKKLFARTKKAEEEVKALKTKPKEDKPIEPVKPVEKTNLPMSSEDIDKMVGEKFEERDLASMDLSDELKAEVKAYAKAKGIPYREAAKSDYFNFIKGKEDERLESEEASASSKTKSKKANRDFGNLSEGDIANLSDDEFVEYKNWLKTQ